MHELGIVMNVVSQVEKAAKENNVEKVVGLTIEVGEVSAVVPELFTDAFDWAKKRTEYLKEAKLNLVMLQAVTYCQDCKKTYSTTEFAKECPYCHSTNTYLVTGDEIKIKSIDVV